MNDDLLTQMIYRIVLCCVSALAVLFTFNFVYVGQGPFEPTWETFKYYTCISNYFVFGVSAAVLADNVRRVRAGERHGFNRRIRLLKFMTTVMILVTFLVVIVLLGNPFTLAFWRDFANVCYHVAAPALFLLDFFLFDEHRSVSVFAPLLSAVLPLLYVVYIFLLGAVIPDFTYPYFFLDVNAIGYGGVAVWLLILLAVFLALGYLMWLYDKLVRVNGKWKLDFSKKLPEPKGPPQ